MPHPVPCTIEGFACDNELLIKLSGALRMQNCDQVKDAVEHAVQNHAQTVFLHLGQLREVDSAGLGTFVGLHMTTRKLDIPLKVLAPNDLLTRLFQTTQLTTILSILSSSEAESIRLRLDKPELALDLAPRNAPGSG